jgi:hypothetical protein
MSNAEADYLQVLQAVQAWPAARRLALAEAILHSLRQELRQGPPRGVPVEQVRGIAAGKGPPPDEITVRRWVDEHLTEKYG